ncbi:MAG TPA: MauE/DoxX family redox-associated membrane protein [Acidimicrobiales bacterium]|nr:MauE/DoxX family redox-associated membrane protein [Acidimicrobiales bacterium]
MELIGIFFVGCGLLVLAGVAKAVRPNETARALILLLPGSNQRSPSYNVTRQAVRVGALLEAGLGMSALLFPRTVTAALVAVSYTVFACITAFARRQGGALSTCGCFGRPDTPSTGLHVVINMVFVATAVALALQPPHYTTLVSLLENQPWDGVPLLLASGVGVWLTYLALSPLAALEAAHRLVAGTTKREALST